MKRRSEGETSRRQVKKEKEKEEVKNTEQEMEQNIVVKKHEFRVYKFYQRFLFLTFLLKNIL
jgi:hypothetical protein